MNVFKSNIYKDKVLMITGGTGSFGSEALKQFLDSDLKEIRIFSRDEEKQDEMRTNYKNAKLNFVIGDIRDYQSIERAMYDVNYVFHAAALKEVPSCEFHPYEAIKTNILGSQNVLNAAITHGVENVVVLSTDKAVYPVNTMGMTKALMEKLAVSKAREAQARKSKTVITATRYGNVMCSRGSVIPLFISQIKKGLPITVTEGEMTRFMMSLTEAIKLVMYAFENGTGGDTFIQKAPAATIINLAAALREIFNVDNEIKIIGSRHAEKMHETLCSKEEMTKAEDLGNYFRIPADFRDLNYTMYLDKYGEKISDREYNSSNTKRLTLQELKDLLLSLEYVQNELRQWR
jgi:UDP-N-acetylglucosamine 4,6-dehydratase